MASTLRPRPLEYDSLKTVIQQMDPNSRFKLCLLLPSLRKVDCVVPLKIKRLEFKPYEFIVNETSYRLGMFRDYGGQDIPAEHRSQNERGGINMDLDEYGFYDSTVGEATTPGDIQIRGGGLRSLHLFYDEEGLNRLEAQVKGYGFLLARKRGENLGLPPAGESDESRIVADDRHFPVEILQNMHDGLQSNLLPYLYRRAGTLPPYTKFAQLNISGHWTLSHNFQKDSRLDQTQKNLTDVLFGHRSAEIHVNRLIVDYDYFTIRLPPGLKFRIRELSMSYNEVGVYKELDSIIDSSSYPLKVALAQNIVEHPLINSAKRLDLQVLDNFEAFQKVCSQVVTVNFSYLSLENYVELVENMLDRPRDTGTYMCFGHPSEHQVTVKTILGALEARFDNVKRGTKSVTIPMRDHRRQIVVSHEPSPDENECWPLWSIVFRVEEVEEVDKAK